MFTYSKTNTLTVIKHIAGNIHFLVGGLSGFSKLTKGEPGDLECMRMDIPPAHPVPLLKNKCSLNISFEQTISVFYVFGAKWYFLIFQWSLIIWKKGKSRSISVKSLSFSSEENKCVFLPKHEKIRRFKISAHARIL